MWLVFYFFILADGVDIQNALFELTGQATVPNIYFSQKSIGGESDLEKLEETVNNLYESKFITSEERTELTNDIRNQQSEVLSSKEELIKKITDKFK